MDRRLLAAVFIIGILSGAIITVAYYKTKGSMVQVYFSPDGGCEQVITHYISHARSSIHILMFSFTLDSIVDALIASHRRGVEVKVVLETEQILSDIYWKLKNAGIEVRNDTNPSFMHDKIAIIDGEIVLTGSYNWTKTAEHANNENLVVIRDVGIAARYEMEFQRIWRQSAG